MLPLRFPPPFFVDPGSARSRPGRLSSRRRRSAPEILNRQHRSVWSDGVLCHYTRERNGWRPKLGAKPKETNKTKRNQAKQNKTRRVGSGQRIVSSFTIMQAIRNGRRQTPSKYRETKAKNVYHRHTLTRNTGDDVLLKHKMNKRGKRMAASSLWEWVTLVHETKQRRTKYPARKKRKENHKKDGP